MIVVDEVCAHEMGLTSTLMKGLSDISGVTVHGTGDEERSIAVVSFTVPGRHVYEVGLRLDEQFGIVCRVGLHCAPAAHRTIGTFPEGTVRFAPGITTTLDEIGKSISAVRAIVES